MFPLSIINYAKIGIACFLLLSAGYTGYALESARFDRYKAEQLAQTQKLQEQYQTATDEIRKKKNEKISSINSQLNNALVQLRGRPSRTDSASNGQSRTGRSLFAEDAEFLEREAARADIIREGLAACYDQYDALRK
jgi:uncharacterized phage infection (PIP) family protein YhgE